MHRGRCRSRPARPGSPRCGPRRCRRRCRSAAAAGGAERNDRNARKVMAFHKGAHDARSLSPPDGVAEIKGGDAVERDVACDPGTCVGGILLHGGAGRTVIIIEILRRIRLGRDKIHKLCAGEGRDLLGDTLCSAGAGEDDDHALVFLCGLCGRFFNGCLCGCRLRRLCGRGGSCLCRGGSWGGCRLRRGAAAACGSKRQSKQKKYCGQFCFHSILLPS